MEFKFVLGIDMSKEWFNFCLMNSEYKILWEGEIENQPDDIFKFITLLLQLDYISSLKDLLLCMEHTGIYTQHLSNCWFSKGGQLTLVHAPKVSQLLGGQSSWEEKDDQLDARRLAEYAFRYKDKLQLWKVKSQTLDKLRNLQRMRSRVIKTLGILKVPINESKNFDSMELSQTLEGLQAPLILAHKDTLKSIENSIQELIESDPDLAQLYQLIISVEGVGPVIGTEIIIATLGFTKFLPTQAKAFARFLGIVPEKKRSGKSLKRKDKIPKRTHKKLKGYLTQGARSLTNTKQELGLYYHRKIAEGKNEMAVINAMRNKMILRVFAVVRNQVIYEKKRNISTI